MDIMKYHVRNKGLSVRVNRDLLDTALKKYERIRCSHGLYSSPNYADLIERLLADYVTVSSNNCEKVNIT